MRAVLPCSISIDVGNVMLSKFDKIEESRKQREKQSLCGRCNLVYEKTLLECPHCSGLNDVQLNSQLEARVKSEVNIVKLMSILVVVLVIFLIVINV